AFARVEAEARRFVAGTPASQLATAQWTTQEWQHFLGALPRGITPAQLGDLDRAFRLSEQGNSEILFAWLQMAVRHRYEPAMPALERFLTSQGRRKFVRPLFASLMEQGEWGQSLARRIYARARPGYHPVTAGSVDEIVGM
ncbi:MAG TPA: leukotriene A4 hydrolase C-terminal domain-containing protein, partial [Longimicrobium sp.]|nr:leukotriene A4 hydrolase C-terminal domain-containing protein [Longimicrobium sp.]